MKPTSLSLHPAFKLNGLDFSSPEEVLNFTDNLLEEGNEQEISVAKFIEKWLDFTEEITVHTSGSTGKPKKIQLTKQQMVNSAKATGTYFKTGPGTKTLLCIPAEFIAGKMMVVRAMVLGWDLHVVQPTKDALVEYDNDYDFVAMVPYQVSHSLQALPKVKKLIIGGGTIPARLEEQLQDIDVEAFATYGMTETITHVAVRRVNGFARSDVYTALPDVRFSQDDRECLIIDAPKISDKKIVTNDLVALKSATSFQWLGRWDNVINSGGIKLFPETIEAKLSEEVQLPFIIASEKDEELGERVILVYEGAETDTPDFNKIFTALAPFEKPKKVYRLSRFVYTETGKIKRGDVLQVLRKYR
ncbi:AMP-binding protein [Marinirhabdus gelatinilytica]|uniref:O-succinylbenzoic acid--CoA ligase n=1 Tax=Marinirhabdus gelatinilytica TaxID=1703343 RepID=A0A370QFV6_9FLAO|nr:AMP-binding protein [Marinirhabdus gelatinilytica]RDK87242.1 O-succinylbenzoic acid--CoA ligase [Marinirhabdus gelatinilytica]